MRNIVDKLWDEKRINVKKYTCNCDKIMFLRVFSRDTEALQQITDAAKDYDSRTTFFGPAGFEVVYTHKDITPSDYFYALVDGMYADNSVKYKDCVELMLKMTHIEYAMEKIKKHFPYASIVDVEQGKRCWNNHYYFTIKLGSFRFTMEDYEYVSEQ